MRGFSVRRDGELFNDPPARDWTWMTAGDAAKVLGVTRRWVNWLARDRQLAGERTMGRQWIFRRSDVRRFVLQRADERSRTREARLRVVHVRMLKVPPWRRETPRVRPRQLAFTFGEPPLRLVARGGERALPDREVKRARSLDKAAGSESVDYVNRNAVAGR